uniref:Uncharacterized protein n=1 Tax=Eptatretus burgeri TaxID=7764 RepID=A0A8C4QMN9_EPTBU
MATRWRTRTGLMPWCTDDDLRRPHALKGRLSQSQLSNSQLCLSTSSSKEGESNKGSLTEAANSLQELQCSLRDLEDRYKEEIMISTQRDKDNVSLSYQMEILRDAQEDLEEELSRTKKNLKEASKENKKLQNKEKTLSREVSALREIIKEKDIKAPAMPRITAGTIREQKICGLKPLAKCSPDEDSQQQPNSTLDLNVKTLCEDKKTLGCQSHQGKKELEEIMKKSGRKSSKGMLSMRLSDYKSQIRNLEEEKTSLEQAVFRDSGTGSSIPSSG